MRISALSLAFAASLVAIIPSVADTQLICGDPVEPGGSTATTRSVTASDALLILRAAVGLDSCFLCVCDTDGSGLIAATDALIALNKAVGQNITLACPFCCEHCDPCTPQALTITIDDIDFCTECIPRVPPSTGDVPDSVRITFDDNIVGTHELAAVAPCEWQTTLPAEIIEKVGYFGTTCVPPAAFTSLDVDVVLRVIKTATAWEVYVGQYAASLTWGDVLRTTIDAPTCESGGSSASTNAICELVGPGSPAESDRHATGGSAEIATPVITPPCP